jgi:hypothetical protein
MVSHPSILVELLWLSFLCSSALGFVHHYEPKKTAMSRTRKLQPSSSTKPTTTTTTTTTTTFLSMSLKPAAIPLMDSGKALARSGELLIDLTSQLDLYGGGLSAAGAQIRNSGDSVAQAAASCRFKTAAELVCDELREGATCLTEATDKLKLAVEEAQADKDDHLAEKIGKCKTKKGIRLSFTI